MWNVTVTYQNANTSVLATTSNQTQLIWFLDGTIRKCEVCRHKGPGIVQLPDGRYAHRWPCRDRLL